MKKEREAVEDMDGGEMTEDRDGKKEMQGQDKFTLTNSMINRGKPTRVRIFRRVKDSRGEKVGDGGGKKNIGCGREKTTHFESGVGLQMFLCIYCNVSLFLIKFSTVSFHKCMCANSSCCLCPA